MEKVFAVPTENGKLCAHFGHCEKFAVIKTEDQKIVSLQYLSPPVHQPGVYPRFLAQQGASVIIAGGMGQRAQKLFNQNQIEVCMGANIESPAKLVEKYLAGELVTAENLCDH